MRIMNDGVDCVGAGSDDNGDDNGDIGDLSNQLTPKWIVPRGSQRNPPTLKRFLQKSI